MDDFQKFYPGGCCDEMRKALDKEIVEELYDGFWIRGLEYKSEMKIYYCPFCRVELTNELWYASNEGE